MYTLILAFKLSDDFFIMLINVKMPIIVGILTFMSMINPCSIELSMKKFLGPGFLILHPCILSLQKKVLNKGKRGSGSSRDTHSDSTASPSVLSEISIGNCLTPPSKRPRTHSELDAVSEDERLDSTYKVISVRQCDFDTGDVPR